MKMEDTISVPKQTRVENLRQIYYAATKVEPPGDMLTRLVQTAMQDNPALVDVIAGVRKQVMRHIGSLREAGQVEWSIAVDKENSFTVDLTDNELEELAALSSTDAGKALFTILGDARRDWIDRLTTNVVTQILLDTNTEGSNAN